MTSQSQGSWVIGGGIAGLSVLMLTTWLVLVRRSRTPNRAALVARLGIGFAAWVGLWLALAASGALADPEQKPPLFAILIPSLVILVAVLSRSQLGTVLAFETPLWVLVGMQAFRLPLELVMHEAMSEGVMPAQMSFGTGGRNFDIITGVTALSLGLLLFARHGQVSRPLIWGWNLMGCLLLINIVVVSALSTPMFARFGSDPRSLNTWVLHAPYVLLPAVLVGTAMLGHVLLFRRL
jgi:hypothetical protein